MNYKRVIEAMQVLKSGNIEDTTKGICFNLIWELGLDKSVSPSLAAKFLKESFESFYGVELLFPVEGDIVSYLENKHKWDKETDMGLRRYDLLDMMIEYAENKLKEEA